MSSKVDPDSLGFLITDTARLLRVAFERKIAAAGLGLTAGEARALPQIAAYEGQRQNVIAEKMGIEPMTFCTYVDRLERAGLAVRGADQSDRRAKLVMTSNEANQMIAEVRRHSSELLTDVQSALEPEARAALPAIMKAMQARLQQILTGPETDTIAGLEGECQ